jgi:hypothetical protein
VKVSQHFEGIISPSSGLKSKPSKKQTFFHAGSLLSIFFDHEDGGNILLQNVG